MLVFCARTADPGCARDVFKITLTGSTVDAAMVLVLGLLMATAVPEYRRPCCTRLLSRGGDQGGECDRSQT